MSLIIESIEIFDITDYVGYKIVTNHGSINFKINDDHQQCCEIISYYVKNNKNKIIKDENLEKLLVGREIINIEIIDIIENVIQVVLILNDEPNKVIFNVENAHNGYYPHQYIINWDFGEFKLDNIPSEENIINTL